MNAIILGGAECLWADLDALGKWDADFIAVNDAGAAFPETIAHWVTLHPEKLKDWKAARTGNADYQVHSHKRRAGCGPVTLHTDWGGSSGLLAVQVAISLGYQRIVLCGVPMDGRAHFHRPGEWPDCMHYRRHWLRRLDQFSMFTRSMSGWTRELLHAPDDAWLGRAKTQGVRNG